MSKNKAGDRWRTELFRHLSGIIEPPLVIFRQVLDESDILIAAVRCAGRLDTFLILDTLYFPPGSYLLDEAEDRQGYIERAAAWVRSMHCAAEETTVGGTGCASCSSEAVHSQSVLLVDANSVFANGLGEPLKGGVYVLGPAEAVLWHNSVLNAAVARRRRLARPQGEKEKKQKPK